MYVIEVALFREHERERRGRGRPETMIRKRCLGFGDDLLHRIAGEYPPRSREEFRQHAAHGGRVHAFRPSRLRIPKVGVVESGEPRVGDDADEPVVAFHRDAISVPAEHEHLGVIGDGRRRCGARQRDFVGRVRDEVAIDGRSRRVRIGLGLLLPARDGTTR